MSASGKSRLTRFVTIDAAKGGRNSYRAAYVAAELPGASGPRQRRRHLRLCFLQVSVPGPPGVVRAAKDRV